MIGIVISGHGQFASGIQSAVRIITGEEQQIAYLNFSQHTSLDELHLELLRAADKVDSGDGVLFLTDIPGSSPFLQAAAVAADLKLADVISGTNLVMAIEAIMARESNNFRTLVDKVVTKGRDHIKSIYIENQK